MKGKVVHHDWSNGAVTYIMSKDEHMELHCRIGGDN